MKKLYSFLMPLLLLGTLSAQTLFFSEAAEGSSNNKYLEIYNPTDQDISLDGYAYPNASNAPSTPGEYEYWNTFEAGAVVPAGGVYVVAHGSSDDAILAFANETMNYLSNGDDGFCLVSGTEDDYTILDCIGDFNGDGAGGYAPWDVAGVSQATKDHTLIRKGTVTTGNPDWASSAGTTADDSEWHVMEQNYWDGLGSHPSDPPEGPSLAGEWKLLPSGGALQVGPNGPGDGGWWSSSVGDVDSRACLFDDLYVFNADGSFQNVLGNDTWVEAWQGYTNDDGSGGEGCAAPVAPHDGSAAATWSVDGDNVTLTGVGAFLGLAKAYNGGELGNPADAPESITYQMMITTDETDQEHLMVAVQSAGGGSGWWTFNFVRPDFVQNVVDLTFNLDMSSQGEGIVPDHIYIAGGAFFGWPGDFPMTRVGDTDVFTTTVTVPMNSSSYYTYINGDGGWDNKEQIAGQACANPDNYNDRYLEWGTEDVTVNECFELCGEGLCSDIGTPDEVTVTFNINMNHVDLADLGLETMPAAVYATGSFEGWSGWGQELTDEDMDGIYSGSRQMLANTSFEYVFNLGGWGSPESRPELGSDCDFIPTDEYANYGAELLSENVSLPAYLWGGGCETVFVQRTTVYINLFDDYGDGWNGAYLTVAGQSFTIDPYQYYSASYTIELEDGLYQWSHTNGSYPSEESFEALVEGENGELVTLFAGDGIYGPFSGVFEFGGIPITPIRDIQFSEDAANGYPSPLVGQEVRTSGVVTAVKHNGAMIQDPVDTTWAGLWLYCGDSDCMGDLTADDAVSMGDVVIVRGEVLEYNLLTEVMFDPVNMEVVGEGGVFAIELTNAEVNNEMYEGMLVFVDGEATDADVSDYGQWEITDETGSVQIEDTFYPFQPTLGAYYEMYGVVGQSSYDGDDVYEVAPVSEDGLWETLPCTEAHDLTLEMYDSFGDSWDNGTFTLETPEGTQTFTVTSGDYEEASLCLPDGSYPIIVDGSSYPSECSWAIYDNSTGDLVLEGAMPYSGVLQLGETSDVLGCTDETALNYDELATVDDGSCYFAGDSCSVAIAAVAGENSADGPAWYTYTTTMDGFLTVSSQNEAGDAPWDTDLYVYESCDLTTLVANNDDCCGYYGPSEVTMPVAAGETYTIEWRPSWSVDAFTFHIVEEAPPAAPQNLVAEGLLESVHLMWEGIAPEGDEPERYNSFSGENIRAESEAYYYAKKADLVEAVEIRNTFNHYKKPENNRNNRNTDVTLYVGGGTWDSEITWAILDATGDIVGNGAAATGGVPFVLADGVYTFMAYDSYGDGWNGAVANLWTADNSYLLTDFTFNDGAEDMAQFVVGDPTVSANLTLSSISYDAELNALLVTVTNEGDLHAQNTWVGFGSDQNDCNVEAVDTYTFVPSLAPGGSFTAGIGGVLEAFGYGTHDMSAVADLACQLAESSEDDNGVSNSFTVVDPFDGVTWIISRSELDAGFVELAVSQSQEFLDDDVVGDREYCYYVQQVDSEGATPSDTSNHACATPIADVAVPAPTALVGEADGWAVHLNWERPDIGGTGVNEGFEGGELPEGWDMSTLAECSGEWGPDSAGWIIVTDGSSAYFSIPEGTGYYAVSNDDGCDSNGGTGDGSEDYLHLPPADFTNGALALTFKSYFTAAYGQSAHVLVSVDGGNTYTEAYELEGQPAEAGWVDVTVDLSAFAGESDVRVVLHSNDGGSWASGWAVDNVSLGTPPDYALMHYNVYRGAAGSEEMVGMSYSEMFMLYELEVGAYTYSVTAVYDVFGESDPSNYFEVDVEGPAPACNAPQNLTASTMGNDVMLHWAAPIGATGWMGHDNGNYSTAVGANAAATFTVASRFLPEQLLDYDGMHITKLQMIVNEPTATYTPMVMVAEPGAEPQVVFAGDPIPGSDLMMDMYNVVDLPQPIAINFTHELWFGYMVDTPAGTPAGMDSGPAAVGLGNLLNWPGVTDGWTALSDLNPTFDFNWSLQAWATSEDGAERSLSMTDMPRTSLSSMPRKVANNEGEIKQGPIFPILEESNTSRDLAHYKIYRNGDYVGDSDLEHTHYADMDLPFGVHNYMVTAYYSDDCGESDPSNMVEVELFNTAPSAPTLVTPQEDEVINVTMDNMDTEVGFIWTPAQDIDGDVVSYILEASYTDANGELVTHMMPEDMTDNPGFEDGHDGYPNYTNPMDWSMSGNHMVFETGFAMFGNPPYTFEAFEGNASLLIWGNYPDDGSTNSTQAMQEIMLEDSQLSSGDHVVLLGHMMTDAYNSLSQGTNHAKLSIQYFDVDNNMLSNENSDQFNGTYMDNVWHRFELHSEVPEGAYRMKYGVKLNQQDNDQHGSVYVDEVHLASPLLEPSIFTTYEDLAQDALEDGVSQIMYAWNVHATDGFAVTPSLNGPRMLTVNVEGLLDVDGGLAVPDVFALHDNYPNPFNPVTNITYDIPEVSDVKIEVFNLAGQRVNTLVNKQHEPGRYRIVWNATNDYGQQLASGMYIYRISAGDFVSVKKLILMK